MILPLPLAPFEEYMLRDSRPAYPMSMFLRFRFSGRLNRQSAEDALRIATGRHPLTSAMVRRVGRHRFEWVAGQPPAIQWVTGPRDGTFPPVRGIDLFSESGPRVWGVEEGDRSALVIEMHHACCDGLGMFQFVEDWLLAYAAAADGAAVMERLCPIEPERLPHRASFGLTLGRFLRMLPDQMVGLLGVRQFLMRRPVPLLPGGQVRQPPLPSRGHEAPDRSGERPPQDFPAVLTQCLTDGEMDRVKSRARAEGVTVNDWLVRDLMLGLADFRARHNTGSPREWLRLSVPINLRSNGDQRLPAANVVSMVFLDRRQQDFADPRRLLAGVHDEMALIKRRKLGFTLLGSLWAFRAIPGGLARMTRGNRCTATAVITNLGMPLSELPLPRQSGRLVAGNVILDGMDLVAPIRYGTAAAFAVFCYAGALCVTLHYDSRWLGPDLAADLLDSYVRQIRRA